MGFGASSCTAPGSSWACCDCSQLKRCQPAAPPICSQTLKLCSKQRKRCEFWTRRPQHPSAQVSCRAFTPESVFLTSTFMIIPVYALLLSTSRIRWAFRIVTSHLVPFILGTVWLGAIMTAGLDVWSHTGLLHSVNGNLQPNIEAFARLFRDKWFTAISWLHLLMLDFVLAREVAIDAAIHRVFAVHSITLCFMCGPLGFLSHRVTKAMLRRQNPDYA